MHNRRGQSTQDPLAQTPTHLNSSHQQVLRGTKPRMQGFLVVKQLLLLAKVAVLQ